MSVMDPDLAMVEAMVVKSTGGLELHLYDLNDTDGTGAGLYYSLGNREESLKQLREWYNHVLESNKLED